MTNVNRLRRLLVLSTLITFAIALYTTSSHRAALAQGGSPTWSQMSPTGGPPVNRAFHSAVYDSASNRMIVFGGATGQLSFGAPPLLNDVWILSNADGGGGSPGWIQLSPAGAPPSPRGAHAAVYDPLTNRMMVFAGDPNIGFCFGGANDIWVLSNANGLGGLPAWTQLSPTGGPPQLRQFPTAVYDPPTNRMIVFGGNNNACAPFNAGEVWVLLNANGLGVLPTWIQLSPVGTGPAPRVNHSAVYDQTSNRMIVFGGSTPTGEVNDVWVLLNANGLGEVPTWTQLSPMGIGPAPRSDHSAVYDSVSNRMIVFAGQAIGSPTAVNDVWILFNANGLGGTPLWMQLNSVGGLPQGRRTHSAILQPTTNRMTVFAGMSCTTTLCSTLGDLWVLSDIPSTMNRNPAPICSDVTVQAGPGCTASASIDNGSVDPDGDPITITHSPPGPYPLGSTSVTLTVTDSHGASSQCTATVTVIDTEPPVIACPASLNVEGNIRNSCSATVSPGSATAIDNCTGVSVVGVRGDGQALNAPYPLGNTAITWTATDGSGNQSSCSQLVTVTNPSPAVTISGPATGSVFAVGTPVTFTGIFTDNPGGTHTAQWTFDTLNVSGAVNESTGDVSASYNFSTAGVYLVSLAVSDGCGGTDTASTIDGLAALVVVYDPNAGFVTGGGWIDSPPGAYVPNPSLTGRASLGFVSRYQRGATIPTGQTEFQFKVANFNFHSTSYDWLVVAGARAQYKGSGTVNGTGNYGFMLTSIDGQISGGGGTDKFRIKIWDKNNGDAIVYDNQLSAPDGDDPTTALGGGSIVIHS